MAVLLFDLDEVPLELLLFETLFMDWLFGRAVESVLQFSMLLSDFRPAALFAGPVGGCWLASFGLLLFILFMALIPFVGEVRLN